MACRSEDEAAACAYEACIETDERMLTFMGVRRESSSRMAMVKQ